MELVPESETESVVDHVDDDRADRPVRAGQAADDHERPRPPRPGGALRWVVVLAEEVAMVPWTIRQTRHALVSLPDRLDRLTDALEETMESLNDTLPRLNGVMADVTDGIGSVDRSVHDLTGELGKTVFALDRLLPELSGMISAMDERMSHMDETVSELGSMARGILGSIPGVRRSVRRPAAG